MRMVVVVTVERALGTLVLVVLINVVSRASAEPLEPATRVLSRDACLSSEALSSAIQGWLSESNPIDASVMIDSVRSSDGMSRIRYRLTKGDTVLGERVFATLPSACSDRLALVGLAIAIALDDATLTRVNLEPPRRTNLKRGALIVLGMGAGASILSRHLGPSYGELYLGAAVLPFAVRLGAFANYGWSALEQGAIETALVSGRFDVCAVATVGASSFGLCQGFAAGAVHAAGHGFSSNENATGLIISSVTRAQASVSLGGFELGVAFDLFVPVVAPRFFLERSDGSELAVDLGDFGMNASLFAEHRWAA